MTNCKICFREINKESDGDCICEDCTNWKGDFAIKNPFQFWSILRGKIVKKFLKIENPIKVKGGWKL